MRLLDFWRKPAVPVMPELDVAGLARAANTYFPGNIGVSDAVLSNLSERFYRDLDLTGRGDRWAGRDVASLERTIPLALDRTRRGRRRGSRPIRLLVIGCGNGRLLGKIAAVALVHHIDEIILNDVHPFLLADARRVVAAMGVEQRGITIRMLPGDITRVASAVACDVAIAWFFVDAEIVSVASVSSLRAKRTAYRTALARALGPGGTLIMDRPDVSTPFYAEVRRLTQRILVGRDLMPGEQGNLDLTWIPGGAQPYHLRYVPTDAAHRAAMAASGFVALDTRVQAADPVRGEPRRSKIVEVWAVAQQDDPLPATATIGMPMLQGPGLVAVPA